MEKKTKKTSKVEMVYEYLLNEMVLQHFVAGDRIIISQIAKACSVSEIPVREALRLLESDGYVHINANHGAIASGLNMDSINNIFQIRGVLEGYATRLSIDYLSVNDLRNLYDINNELKQASINMDYSLYSKLNVDFHMYMYEKTQMKELITLITDLWRKWRITTKVFTVAPDRMDISYQEHNELLHLIESRQYDAVEQFARSHKFNAAEQLISHPSNSKLQ